MAFDSKGLDSYIDVAQRIADFRERYRDGRLQPLDPATPYQIVRVPAEWCRRCTGARSVKTDGRWKTCPRCEGTGLRGEGEPTQDTFIVYSAAAYRDESDSRPGIGVAWEAFPGQTPYTAGSELMNAETSAWGRAIVAALASDSRRGVSSREEVRNRAAEQDDGPQPPRALADLPRNRDGSISRSRCTEEELEAIGMLRGEKKAEHDALRKGVDGKLPDDEAAKIRGCSPGNPCAEADCPNCTPGADLWTEEQEPAPARTPLRAPRTPQSLTSQIGTYFSTLGITDRDVRLGITAQIAGTGRLSSSKDLTASQARKVRDVLAQCRDGAALREYLDSNQEVSASA
jgi:hypothetical protein